MKTIIFTLLVLLPINGLGLTIIGPHLIQLTEASDYGINVKRVIGTAETVIYLSFDTHRFCPVEKVKLREEYLTVGKRERYLSKYGSAYTASFRNEQDYERVMFIITCSKFHSMVPTKLLALVIK